MRANVENKTRKFTFKPNALNMYSKRQIPAKAFEALEVLGKIVARFDSLVTMFDADAAQYNAQFLLSFTTTQALDAYAKNEKAYLPRVFRHLLVKVRQNWKDGGAISVVQAFSNNAKYMKMLDDAWSTPSTETLFIDANLSDTLLVVIAYKLKFYDVPHLARLWDLHEKGPLTEKTKSVVVKAINRAGFEYVKLSEGALDRLIKYAEPTTETAEPEIVAPVAETPKIEKLNTVSLEQFAETTVTLDMLNEHRVKNGKETLKGWKKSQAKLREVYVKEVNEFVAAFNAKDPNAEINAKGGHELIRDMMRKEQEVPKPEPKTIDEIEVGGKVTSIKTIPKALVISMVPTAISKGRTFTVTAITPRKGGDILTLDNGLARVPAEYFEIA